MDDASQYQTHEGFHQLREVELTIVVLLIGDVPVEAVKGSDDAPDTSLHHSHQHRGDVGL